MRGVVVTARQDALTAATVPYALTGLGTHMLDHELPAPLSIDIPGRGTNPITVWVDPEHVEAWITTGILPSEESAEPSPLLGGYRHTVHGILEGSSLRVRILWHTDPEPVCDCLRPPTEQDAHGDIHDRDCPLWEER